MRHRVILPLALAALAAPAVGCGQDNSRNLIPSADAEQLVASVDRIGDACADNDVRAAADAVAEARAQIAQLPQRVDDRLEANMNQWLNRIDRRLERDCKAEETATPAQEETETQTRTPTPTPTPTPTATETPAPEPTETPPEEVPGADEENGGGTPAPETGDGQ
jgi:membrane-bound lytic murein transglycosylase